jgi:hypothetical protein
MNNKKPIYNVIMNGNSIGAFQYDVDAFVCVKKYALANETAEFTIEKKEVLFNSKEDPNDKASLVRIRSRIRSHNIHCSIHESDRLIGWEDF